LADSAALQKVLGVSVNSVSLLEQALVHSSYANEKAGLALSNERLEFLGDAILDLVVAEKLYSDFPHLTEGEMTKLRAVLVSRDTLFHAAKSIRLGDYLYLGRGEETGGGRDKPVNLAGALEAVIAAIYLDQGLVVVRDCILRILGSEIRKATSRGAGNDYKSQLQEMVQAKKQPTPEYYIIEAVGPDHLKEFTVEVKVGDTVLGKGSGKSKKAAEGEAARMALERLYASFTQ
jgi:ribonuclease-3